MRSWSPKRRKYWGYKQNGSSDSTEQEESDSSSTERPPMPWEPQDSTEDNTMYWKGEDSDEPDLSGEYVLPTTVITAERTQPEQSRSLIDQIQGKAPEDINPRNFLGNIIRGMIKGKRSDSSKVIANNAVMGPEEYTTSPNIKEKEEYFGEGLDFQSPDKLSHDNKVWPSGYIFPIPDSFKIYKSRSYSDTHHGIDIVGQTSGRILGQPILSVCDGIIDKVVKANELIEGGGKDSNPGGIRVRVKDSSGLHYIYYHLLPESNHHLKIGQMVSQGEVIGKVGSSGRGNFDDRSNGTGIHLHFEMWSGFDQNGRPIYVNFLDYFPELNEIPNQ